MSEVVVVIGAGSIGQAIARRVSAGKHVVLADLHLENADDAAEVMRDAGFDVSTATVDVWSRECTAAGLAEQLILVLQELDAASQAHAAGLPDEADDALLPRGLAARQPRRSPSSP